MIIVAHGNLYRRPLHSLSTHAQCSHCMCSCAGKKRKVSTESKENGSVPENTSGSDDSLDSEMYMDVRETPERIATPTSKSPETHSQIPEPEFYSDTSHTEVTEDRTVVSFATVGSSVEDGVTSGPTGVCQILCVTLQTRESSLLGVRSTV